MTGFRTLNFAFLILAFSFLLFGSAIPKDPVDKEIEDVQKMIEEKAVNVDRHESDFQTISKGIINKSFHHLNPYWISEDESLGRIISSVRWGRELWKEFLLLGLVVLLIEMVIARVWKEFKSSS